MMHTLIVTFTGPDQTGIVERLARLVADHHGNWEQSRLASLAGRFAGILKVSLPSDQVEALVAKLHGLEASEAALSVLIDNVGSVSPEQDIETPPDPRRLLLELTGTNHKGIIRDISQVLAAQNINILELSTEYFSAAMSGESMFLATAELECKEVVAPEALEKSLQDLAQDLLVHIELSDED